MVKWQSHPTTKFYNYALLIEDNTKAIPFRKARNEIETGITTGSKPTISFNTPFNISEVTILAKVVVSDIISFSPFI